MKRCSVTVHLFIDKKNYEAFEYSEIMKTKSCLLRAADRAACPKRVDPVSEEKVCCRQLSEMRDHLWRNFGKPTDIEGLDRHLKIYEARDPYEESEFVASDILRKVMAGARFRDFAIITRNGEDYRGIIDSALEGAKIPYFISRKNDISYYEAIKLIYTACEAIENGFTKESVITYAKSRLCGISAEACDEFELYVEKWQINKSRFCDGIFWNMSPEGYIAPGEGAEEALLRIDSTRRAIIDPLVKFKENMDEAKTVRAHGEALFNFLTEIRLEAALEKRALELRALGESGAAEDNERLFGIICNALDALVSVLGDFEIDNRGFISQLKVVLGEADIGRIPTFYDEVTVGSADMIRLSGKKYVYLLGVNEGKFPGECRTSSYFNDAEKLLLSELGLAIEPENEIATARELFFFSRAFAAASEEVTILYPVRDASLAETKRAEVIDRIYSKTDKKITPRRILELSDIDKIYYPGAALESIGRAEVQNALLDSGYIREARLCNSDIENGSLKLSEESLKLMYPGDMALTQTRIDTYVGCPLAYYLRYNIKLSENGRAEFDARNIGTFIHAILENFFAEVRENGISAGGIAEDTRHSMIRRAAEKYLSRVLSESGSVTKRTEILLDRLCRSAEPVVDGLCRELAGSSFVPRYFELRIGGEDENLPHPAAFKSEDGKNVYVYGSIDRVDTYNHEGDVYVRVIDYKTGAKTFSPTDLDEGKNLQMFLYLKAIVETDNEKFKAELGAGEGGEIIPAGVIYVKTDMSDVTVKVADPKLAAEAISKKQERRGMLLHEEESIGAMNPEFLPIKLKKDGTPDARSQKYLYSREGWDELNRKISDKVSSIATRMKAGDITAAKPGKGSPCEYCKFKPICRK
jgi:ATP-dependent helicase/nuclease subunit B